MSAIWAHSANDRGDRHLLRDHLLATARLARSFAEPFGAGDLAFALALCHDAGKAGRAWQRRLLEVEGRGLPVGIPHKALGARMLRPLVGQAAAAIYGHHGGLPDGVPDEPAPDDDETWARLISEVPQIPDLIAGPPVAPPAWRESALVAELGIRLTFSALVDADHLDTGAHFRSLRRPALAPPADMAALLRRFEQRRLERLAASLRRPSPIDEIREELYRGAVEAARGRPGIYRLPAPTGSGKTITAAGFALTHAAKWKKSRIIVAVPFISITEQNAGVYRDLLDTDTEHVVLEHHSNVEIEDRWQRAATENWDAPFVVTTTVQLFESLFGNRPGRCRKLHRLANSVIVLDEVQALPQDVLVPILDALRTLTTHFGATVLLTSATQPAVQSLRVWRDERITELVPDRVRLFDQLRRVSYEWRLTPRPTFAQIADELATERQALAVVNAVADARTLYRLVRRGSEVTVRHLSARMCPWHRRRVLAEVRELLRTGEPVLLISTQLIEAGVDVDFPVVYRALAGADSLQQAAGRANREGLLPEPGGRVVIFDPSDGHAPASYVTPIAQTRRHFGPGRADPDDPRALDGYYQALYRARNLDNHPRTVAVQRNRERFRFHSVADGPLKPTRGLGAARPSAGQERDRQERDRKLAFRMLDDDTVPVVVPAADRSGRVTDLIAEVRGGGGSLRALQPYTVQLPRRIATDPAVRALCADAPIVGDLLEWRGGYDNGVGLDEGAIGRDAVW